ncbi:MAG: BlaR1 family beta-lactam sensor/signal transducer [Lachnospiraceae bacterium]|nr:BlaR1 family beta-lactam sensor/signal transducer [Lachnospiraceae bacterium]
MADFGIRFFLCNIFICAIISILLITKQVFGNYLSSRMQFHLWYLLSGLLAVPFIPLRPVGFSQFFLWLYRLKSISSENIETIAKKAGNTSTSGITKPINDFALSVSSGTPSIVGLILFWIWLIGIFTLLLFMIKSISRLNILKKSALPLQNKDARILYNNCLIEMKIKRDIPIYSTAFLKSPIIVGLFRPCIYLPIHLISDFHSKDMRYMLLHELQHYKYKDALASYLMSFFGILYWFNPLVWYALKEMLDDREIACDTSVLKLLQESDYEDYGNTLINFAEKISLTPFPFAAGISGSMKQIQKRIINISSYKKPSVFEKLKGLTAFGIIGVILLGLTPMLSTYAADQSRYQWNTTSENISVVDLSAYFSGYEGSFVLYSQRDNKWQIYDMDRATLRTAPNSTYKIYDALFGLEEGVITPEDSFMAWNGTEYPFETWNTDHNLYSAMESSVNWYFQEIDNRLGASAIRNYVDKIGYGNETINANLSSYWMQGTLKISPVEQVGLLTDLHNNRFHFAPENVDAVKESICLFSSENKSFYGKTGTGRIDGQDVNGWFIGYIETADNTYFFATNIQSTENATGSKASEISLSILSNMGIWQ